MARKTFEDLIDEAKNAESTEQTEPVSEEPVSQDQTVETEPVSQDQPEPEKPVEQDQPAPEPEKAPEPEPAKDAVMDEIDNTNSIIRKRLEKQSKKYEEALAEKDARYDELKKELEELKKVAQPKPVVKNRGDFEHDEDYVAYLTRQQIAEVDAEKAKAKAEADAKEAERKAAEEKEQAEIRERQTRFMANIDECFEGDEKSEFLKRVQHANSKGLGTLSAQRCRDLQASLPGAWHFSARPVFRTQGHRKGDHCRQVRPGCRPDAQRGCSQAQARKTGRAGAGRYHGRPDG